MTKPQEPTILGDVSTSRSGRAGERGSHQSSKRMGTVEGPRAPGAVAWEGHGHCKKTQPAAGRDAPLLLRPLGPPVVSWEPWKAWKPRPAVSGVGLVGREKDLFKKYLLSISSMPGTMLELNEVIHQNS